MNSCISISYSSRTGLRSLQSVCNGGFIKDGADHRKGNLPALLLDKSKGVFGVGAAATIQSKEATLSEQTLRISKEIINTKPNSDGAGGYRCFVIFGSTTLLIEQAAGASNIVIGDPKTGEKQILENIRFPELQKRLLVQYIAERHGRGYLATNLSPFDLSSFNGTGISLADVDFSHTMLDTNSLTAILQNGCKDLRGASLTPDTNASRLNLADVALDKNMADALIAGRADFKTVLTSYFDTPPGLFSRQFKAVMLKQYMDQLDQCVQQKLPVDLSDFDLRNVNFNGICFKNKLLSPANFLAILAGGGNVAGAILKIAPDIKFDAKGMSKAVALQLIKASVDPQFAFVAYLTSERNLKHVDIDIAGFDLTRINLRDIDLRGVNLSPLFRFKGEVMINGARFAITTRSGWVQVKAEKPDNDHAACALQEKLNASAARKNQIMQMTHDALPAAMQRLKPEHWTQIGNRVLQEIRTKSDPQFFPLLKRVFYNDIYERASSDIKYVFSNPSKQIREQQWHEWVKRAVKNPEWKPTGIKYGRCGEVQMNVNDVQQAKIYLRYHQKPTLSRLQFVVSSKAGPALYTDIARVMDAYIERECIGKPELSPVKYFKVFSEDGQVGRSDSAVFYLSVPLSDERVSRLVNYLNSDPAINGRIAPVEIIGAKSISQSHIQGVTFPTAAREIEVIGKQSDSSHGGLIYAILAQAYKQASDDMRKDGTQPADIDVTRLNQYAQFYTKEMWHELGL